MNLPYLTHDLPGIGGTLRNRHEDFVVEEIPAYPPSGEGEHVYCEIEKRGLSTFDAVDRIARVLKVNPREIGFAGMKDAQAVTRQALTVPRVKPEDLLAIQSPALSVKSATPHLNKMRLGHLRGNRFSICVREVESAHFGRVQPILDRLLQHGVPNFFGEQRFGRRGDNDRLGASLLRADADATLRLLLGSPLKNVDPSNVFEARRFFESGDFEAAMKKWPRSSGMERRVLARFINTGSAGKALSLLEPRLRRLWLSALQSRVFNDVVAERLASLGKLLPGDLAYLHDRGACFVVEDAVKEQPRADAFEISPTGPMLGFRMSLPSGPALELEQAIYDQYALTREDFKRDHRDQAKGDRRPIRVKPTDLAFEPGDDTHGPFVRLKFTLPAGSFATVLLREVMKADRLDDESTELD
jgi:tRNA pseudouridine13 synthase